MVTQTDKKNSQGAEVQTVLGIDLIAGNDDEDMQPFVKGDNMLQAMQQRMVHHINKLNGIVDGLLMYQFTFNAALTSHFHFSPFFGIPTSPSPTVVPSGIMTMMNHLFADKKELGDAQSKLFKCTKNIFMLLVVNISADEKSYELEYHGEIILHF